MKTILATAYAINPYKGSEDGTGWQYALQIARFQHLIIYTRENNEEPIRRFIKEHKDISGIENITFKFYDTPYFLRFWKKGGRGALLYYYMWQIGIALKLKRTEQDYDIVHNLNFHNNWTPSFLWVLKKPLVWGPVAFHPQIPKQYTGHFSFKSKLKESATWMMKRIIWWFDPFLKIARKKASKILAPNTESFDYLGVEYEKRVPLISVASEVHDLKFTSRAGKFKVLSVGRFVDLKGFDIVLKSFHLFYDQLPVLDQVNVELHLIGKGPNIAQLQKYINDNNLENRVFITEWLEREKLKEHYELASCFLFGSHEGAGMVVPEAMSYFNPVICFNNIGPGVMVDDYSGIRLGYTNYDQSIEDFSTALLKLYQDPKMLEELSLGARKRFEQELTWDKKGEVLKDVYDQVV